MTDDGLERARRIVHQEHSRGMPIGYIAPMEKCVNPNCVAMRKNIEALESLRAVRALEDHE